MLKFFQFYPKIWLFEKIVVSLQAKQIIITDSQYLVTTQQQIEELLRSTGDQRIIHMIPILAQSTFYTAHCHHHHHFKGGLAEHSLGVVKLMLAKRNLVQRYGRANVIIAGMFHDICTAPSWNNVGLNHNGHKMHGRRSVRILGEVFKMHLDDDVYEAIKYHMHEPRKDAHGKNINWMHAALRHADQANAAAKP